MASSTPVKETVVIKLTPTTKQFTCIICGENKQNRKDRQKLEHADGTPTNVHILIEKLIGIRITSDSHSTMCCRPCGLRLQTIDKSLEKFKQTYSSVQKLHEQTHGQKVIKRMTSEHPMSTKRKALFPVEDNQECIEAVPIIDEPEELEAEDYENVKYGRLIEALISKNETLIVEEVMKITKLVESMKDRLFDDLKEEIRHLCSKATNSILRDGTKEKLLTFSFRNVMNEWKEKAPLFHRFIMSASVNPKSRVRNKLKKDDSILHAQVSAGCKLLNVYNRDMKSLQQINNIIFLKGGLKKSGFGRMSSTKDSQTYRATIDLANKLAESWDDDLSKWQERVKSESEIEQQLLNQITYISDTIDLCGGEESEVVGDLVLEKASLQKELEEFRAIMHPGYYFVGDNVDMVTKVRHMTVTNQNKDAHMYQMCAYQNRVSGNACDDTKPLQDAQSAKFGQLIPGPVEHEQMIDNFAYIVAKQWCTSVDHLQPYLTVLPDFIVHPYLKETKQQTVRVNMGVLQKNESKNEDMTDICKFLHKYVPGHDPQSVTNPVKILSGGDNLTFERHKQSQMSVRDDETPSLRLEGLVPKMEEFHNQAEVLKVMWQTLYSTASSRDIGTMFAARNIVNAKNVTKDPAGNYYACATMADKFTKAYITAGALQHFGMNTVSEEPKTNQYSGDIGNKEQMKIYILQQARSFVEEFVCISVKPLPNYGPQSLSLKCRFCQKEYKQPSRLRKHEHREHEQEDPLYDEASTATEKSENSSDDDLVLKYTKLSLTLGLLRLNHNDAISLGDGDRIMQVNQYLYLLYKRFGCPKYAFGILETICQSKILLSERLAQRLIWNRCVNHRGKVNTNHPNDLDLEHCNKTFKDEAHSFRGVFTEKTVSRVSRSAVCTNNIVT